MYPRVRYKRCVGWIVLNWYLVAPQLAFSLEIRVKAKPFIWNVRGRSPFRKHLREFFFFERPRRKASVFREKILLVVKLSLSKIKVGGDEPDGIREEAALSGTHIYYYHHPQSRFAPSISHMRCMLCKYCLILPSGLL